MKFTFDGLGVLDRAEIDLSDLTIVCGENNKGKTYLSYAIYGFLKTWELFFKIDIPPTDLKKLETEGVLEIDLEESYVKNASKLLKHATKDYIHNLHNFLAAQKGRFDKTKMDVSLPVLNIEEAYKKEFKSEKGKTVVSFSKPAHSQTLKITAVSEKKDEFASVPKEMIADTIKDILWGKLFPRTFVVSTERTGAAAFKSELNLAKNRLIELAHNIKTYEKFSPMTLIETVFDTGYPWPVNDNVNFLTTLDKIESNTSPLFEKNPELLSMLEDVTGGTYKTTKKGQIEFITKKGHSKLNMSESSSSVRSLVLLWYYIRHVAQQNDLLIVDEPELNLHPESQRKIARFFVSLVNAGIKVLVTTHSDYLVKEINTLIMLNNKHPKIKEIRVAAGYGEADSLSIDRVNLYMIVNELAQINEGGRKTKANILKKADIDPVLGISAETFDTTIDNMNRVQSQIYDAISEQ